MAQRTIINKYWGLGQRTIINKYWGLGQRTIINKYWGLGQRTIINKYWGLARRTQVSLINTDSLLAFRRRNAKNSILTQYWDLDDGTLKK